MGEGRNLRVAVKRMSDALVAEGFPEMELWSPMHGAHNALVTVERYASFEAWMEYNATATSRPALVSGVFDGIYPTTAVAYDTEDPDASSTRQTSDDDARRSSGAGSRAAGPGHGLGLAADAAVEPLRHDGDRVFDTAADGRRVAVIEGAIWPDVGAEVTVHEDADHVRRGTVAKVELVLEFRAPARIVVWAELAQESA